MPTVAAVTVNWGDVPAWASTVVTTAGFAAAVYQLRLGRQDRQEEREQAQTDEAERREAMARAVGVKVDWGDTDESKGVTPVTVEVMNGGPYPVSGAVLVIDADEYPMEVVIGTVLAGESVKDTYEARRTDLAFGELTSGATLRFTDTYGKHWSKTPNDLTVEDLPARIC